VTSAHLTIVIVASVVLMAALGVGWRLTWLATRLDRAHVRVELTWAALDAALVRRAQRAAALIQSHTVDPAAALLLADAAGAALEPDLSRRERERVESDLSRVLKLVSATSTSARDAVGAESVRAGLSRHLHNEAVTTARSLRRRRVATTFRLAGHAQEPRPFEMADDLELGWPRDG
jgi:hypothetical protein